MIEITELVAPVVVSPPGRYVEKIPGARGYVVTHYDSSPIQRPELTIIYCGGAAAVRPTGSLSDILTNGTRLINRRWSELSAMYRIWQDGPQSDVVGFAQYRRYLSFNPSHTEPLMTLTVDDLQVVQDACYDEHVIKKVSQTYCVVPKSRRFTIPVADLYRHCHYMADYEITRKVAVGWYPHIAAEFDQQLVRKDLYACNLFYLCWADFDDLCRFWFSVLGEFCSQIKWPRGDSYQDRDVSFLAERLFDVWIRARQKAGLQLDERTTLLVV